MKKQEIIKKNNRNFSLIRAILDEFEENCQPYGITVIFNIFQINLYNAETYCTILMLTDSCKQPERSYSLSNKSFVIVKGFTNNTGTHKKSI